MCTHLWHALLADISNWCFHDCDHIPLLDLHHTKLTHTDLKPENILFASSDHDVYYDTRKVGVTSIFLLLWQLF